MIRNVLLASITGVGLVTAYANRPAVALDIVWDGGEGFWDEGKWNGGMFATDLTGAKDGSNGYASPNGGETFIISGADSSVVYDADFLMSDFRIKQGSALQIENGATWSQPTEVFWSENRWTEYDGDGLIIDGGIFRRTGEVPGEGGGVLTFGSWRGDDNFDNPLSMLDHQETNITITGGGRLENEGQLWFGSWGDQAPGLVVNMTINDGFLDLTGGSVNATDDAFWDGDLAFTYDRDDQGMPKGETYTINFTGPGTITVDDGIVVAERDEANAWTGGPFQAYEDLWNRGILQANGMSGLDGASFDDFFTVSGTPVQQDYTLTSLVMTPSGISGDYNGNGTVEQADLDLVLLNWGHSFDTLPTEWVNERPTEGIVSQAQLDGVLLNWGNTAGLGAAGGVPEPSTWLIMCIAVSVGAVYRAKRRG